MPALSVREFAVVFDIVMTCDGLVVPTFTAPKESADGEAAIPVPCPVRDTCCGLFPALSVIVSIAVRVPGTVGLK